jgi:hypothetical protein
MYPQYRSVRAIQTERYPATDAASRGHSTSQRSSRSLRAWVTKPVVSSQRLLRKVRAV